MHKHSVTLNQTITHTIVKQKILFLHTAEGRQACGGTEIRPHPSLEMSYSPPTNNQQVHAARRAGIGPDGVIPSARQRVTSWTEITSPAFKNTLTGGRRGDIESASWRAHPPAAHPSIKRWLSVNITAPCHLVMSLCQREASGKLKKPQWPLRHLPITPLLLSPPPPPPPPTSSGWIDHFDRRLSALKIYLTNKCSWKWFSCSDWTIQTQIFKRQFPCFDYMKKPNQQFIYWEALMWYNCGLFKHAKKKDL